MTAQAKVAGIIGWPVSHSRSPLIHATWLARHKIDGAYVPLPVAPGRLPDAVRGVAAAGFAGANVTIPYKQAVIPLCDGLDASARRAGAVNTLVFGSRIMGHNTDGWGFLEAMRAADVRRDGAVLILGAGGAARSIAAALQDAGASVRIANRNAERAEALAAELPGLTVVPWAHASDSLADADVLVNATSLGMHGQPALSIDLTHAPGHMAVADIVYVPLETPLLAAARSRGLKAVDGLGMLMHQARPGFHAWFGVMPVADAALRAILAADLAA